MAPSALRRIRSGRKKTEPKFIENEKDRQVAFSKCRARIFKKATELSILCGVQIGLVIFLPSNKAYSFGNPSLESVCDRFLKENNQFMPNQHDSVHVDEKLQRLKEKRDQAKEEMKKNKRVVNESWQDLLSDAEAQTPENNFIKLQEPEERAEKSDLAKVEMDGNDAATWLKL